MTHLLASSGRRARSKPGSQFQITVHSSQGAPYCLLPPMWTSLFANHPLSPCSVGAEIGVQLFSLGRE